MANLYDYLQWRGDLSFAQAPLNEVDALILCWLSYTEWNDTVPGPGEKEPVLLRDAVQAFLSRTTRKTDASAAYSINAAVTGGVVARRAAETRRFGELQVCGFINEIAEEEQKQFSAVTFLWEDHAFAAYRGTDSTMVGWRENFNLSLSSAVPAQKRAAEYLFQVPQLGGRSLSLGGHSKGGNLAVYAAVQCPDPIRKQIECVWNFDGPGFVKDFIRQENYLSIRSRIRKIIPHDSVVGMLLEHGETPDVVESAQSGLFQHNGVLWEVMADHFVRSQSISGLSRILDKNMEEWLETLDEEGRKEFIQAFFSVLDATGAERIEDLSEEGLGGLIRAVKALNGMEDEKKRMLLGALANLIRTGNDMLYQTVIAPSVGLLDKGQKALREFLGNVTHALGMGNENEKEENGEKKE